MSNENINDEEKERYLKLNHRLNLAYEYKKIFYKDKLDKIIPKKPKGPYQTTIKELKGKSLPKGVNSFQYAAEKFKELNQSEKKVYKEKYLESINQYEETIKNFKVSCLISQNIHLVL